MGCLPCFAKYVKNEYSLQTSGLYDTTSNYFQNNQNVKSQDYRRAEQRRILLAWRGKKKSFLHYISMALVFSFLILDVFFSSQNPCSCCYESFLLDIFHLHDLTLLQNLFQMKLVILVDVHNWSYLSQHQIYVLCYMLLRVLRDFVLQVSLVLPERQKSCLKLFSVSN